MEALERFATIGLADLNARAELLRRFDTKYLVPLDRVDELCGSLPAHQLVLLNDGRLATNYTTNYYDTVDLTCYFDHLKRRRKRFKIRTRHYGDPHGGYLEIKIKKPRDQTEKVRFPCDVAMVGESLSNEHLSRLSEALHRASYPGLEGSWQRTLETTFTRATLFDPVAVERLTVDSQLRARGAGSSIDLGRSHVIVEIKSPTQVGRTHRVLTRMGIRPMSLSKYCMAMSVLDPSLRGAPWRAPLRTLRAPR